MEKGLNTQKRSIHSTEDGPVGSSRDSGSPHTLSHPGAFGAPEGAAEGRLSADDEDEEDNDRTAHGMFPAKLIKKENRRHSFFSTILNPSQPSPHALSSQERPGSAASSHGNASSYTAGHIQDPVSSEILSMDECSMLVDMFFLRLNPFINLFDASLHTTAYLRNKSAFLFTTIIAGSAKYFRPEIYRECRKIAQDMAIQAFAEGSKSVEICQAYACLTYWRESDENRTWQYIGYVSC
jgi:hypothetical protein